MIIFKKEQVRTVNKQIVFCNLKKTKTDKNQKIQIEKYQKIVSKA